MGDGGHSRGGRSKVLINFGCQNVARGLDFARSGVRKGDPSGPVRRKSYDFALRVALWIQKRVNVGICFGKRVHVRSNPSPTPLLSGVGGGGRRPVNPPTPEGAKRAGASKSRVRGQGSRISRLKVLWGGGLWVPKWYKVFQRGLQKPNKNLMVLIRFTLCVFRSVFRYPAESAGRSEEPQRCCFGPKIGPNGPPSGVLAVKI